MLFTSTRPLWAAGDEPAPDVLLPWGPLPLAVVVVTLAAMGGSCCCCAAIAGELVLFARCGRALRDPAPHIQQENVTTRYALPIVEPIGSPGGNRVARARVRHAWAGRARSVDGASRRDRARGNGPRGVLQALTAYAREPAPVFPVVADMRNAGRPEDVVVAIAQAAVTPTRGGHGAGSGRRVSRGGCWTRPPAMSGSSSLATGARVGPGGAWMVADLRRSLVAYNRRSPICTGTPTGTRTRRRRFPPGVVGGTGPGPLDWVVIDGPPVVPRPGMGAVAGDRRRVECQPPPPL